MHLHSRSVIRKMLEALGNLQCRHLGSGSVPGSGTPQGWKGVSQAKKVKRPWSITLDSVAVLHWSACFGAGTKPRPAAFVSAKGGLGFLFSDTVHEAGLHPWHKLNEPPTESASHNAPFGGRAQTRLCPRGRGIIREGPGTLTYQLVPPKRSGPLLSVPVSVI